jgi:hypothetical protein
VDHRYITRRIASYWWTAWRKPRNSADEITREPFFLSLIGLATALVRRGSAGSPVTNALPRTLRRKLRRGPRRLGTGGFQLLRSVTTALIPRYHVEKSHDCRRAARDRNFIGNRAEWSPNGWRTPGSWWRCRWRWARRARDLKRSSAVDANAWCDRLRERIAEWTDLSHFSQAYLNKIALRLNQRPRKTLGFETPADRLRAVLQ